MKGGCFHLFRPSRLREPAHKDPLRQITSGLNASGGEHMAVYLYGLGLHVVVGRVRGLSLSLPPVSH